MYQVLKFRNIDIKLPSERNVYRIMVAIGLIHRPKPKPHGITKADCNARRSEDLLCRNFQAAKPLTKAVTDITDMKLKDGKLYLSLTFAASI